VCVYYFDHHCVFSGTCVGQRNYRYFFATALLACCTGLLQVLTIPSYLYQVIVVEPPSDGPSRNAWQILLGLGPFQIVVLAALFLVGLIFCVSFGGLTLMHLNLLRRNVTQLEQVRRVYELPGAPENPHARRGCVQIVLYLLSRTPRSLVWNGASTDETLNRDLLT